MSDQSGAHRLRSLAALNHVDRDPLTFWQLAHAGAAQSRRAHENILAAAVTDDEAEPFIGGIELDRPDLLDRGLIGVLIRRLGPAGAAAAPEARCWRLH